MKVHVSNLSPKTTEEHLRKLFEKYGSATILELEWTRRGARSDGRAIVLMDPIGAMTATKELNGRAFNSRRLYVNLIDRLQTRNRSDVA